MDNDREAEVAGKQLVSKGNSSEVAGKQLVLKGNSLEVAGKQLVSKETGKRLPLICHHLVNRLKIILDSQQVVPAKQFPGAC